MHCGAYTDAYCHVLSLACTALLSFMTTTEALSHWRAGGALGGLGNGGSPNGVHTVTMAVPVVGVTALQPAAGAPAVATSAAARPASAGGTGPSSAAGGAAGPSSGVGPSSTGGAGPSDNNDGKLGVLVVQSWLNCGRDGIEQVWRHSKGAPPDFRIPLLSNPVIIPAHFSWSNVPFTSSWKGPQRSSSCKLNLVHKQNAHSCSSVH